MNNVLALQTMSSVEGDVAEAAAVILSSLSLHCTVATH